MAARFARFPVFSDLLLLAATEERIKKPGEEGTRDCDDDLRATCLCCCRPTSLNPAQETPWSG